MSEYKNGYKIVVASGGFVYLGEVLAMSDGVLVSEAKNIRVWGTTVGLGQLALGGPTSKTTLDIVGDIFVPTHAIMHLITTHKDKWVKS